MMLSTLGVQTFQLTVATDPFWDSGEEDSLHKTVQVVVDASNKSVSLDGKALTHTFWNDTTNSVAWACPDSRISEGHLSFNDEGNSVVGLLAYSSGDRVIVTGEPTEPPPEYVEAESTPAIVDEPSQYAKAGDQDSFGTAFDAPVHLLEKPVTHGLLAANWSAGGERKEDKETEEVGVTVYETQRRLVEDKDGKLVKDSEWSPFYNFAYGITPNDDFSLVVILGKDDISDAVDTEHGRGMVLFKSEGDAEKKERDYTFHITINPGIEESERTFKGTLTDRKGVWEWKGEFFMDQTRKVLKTPPVVYGPDGKSTRQQLLMISSLNSTGKDIAQQEGDRIFGKLLLASIPEDAKKKLYPDAPKLDKDEQAIADLAPDYLAEAAVVNILRHITDSESIPQAQRSRINKAKCDVFFAACITPDKSEDGKVDPVEAYGWDRKKDAATIGKYQKQANAVSVQCYRLGYIRAVKSFQPFLKDAAYWYKRLVQYLESAIHLRQFTHRVRSEDDRVERDVYDWYTKLTLLHNVCGDLEGVSNIEDVMSALQGASTVASLDSVEWTEEFTTHLGKFFEKLDEVHEDPQQNTTEDYLTLQKLMPVDRGSRSWTKLGQDLIRLVKEECSALHRNPSVTELSALLARKREMDQLKRLPQYWDKLKDGVPASIISVGLWALFHKLDGGKITLSEQISIYATLTKGVLNAPGRVFIGPLKLGSFILKYLSLGVAWCLGKIIPQRAYRAIQVARAIKLKVKDVAISIKGHWKTFGKTIKIALGFFVSCFCVWAVADGFLRSLHDPNVSTLYKWFKGAELVLASLNCITMCVQFGAAIWGTGEAAVKLVALCGTMGSAFMSAASGLVTVLSIISMVYKEDPVKDFINKYGKKYNLLVKP